MLARALDAWWDQLDRPAPFEVVEAGAGRGTLARSVLAARPACGDALELVLVERSEALRAEHPDGVTSLAELPERIGTGMVLANELLDNLPFRVIERTDDGWRDVYVDLDVDGHLVERLGPPAGASAGEGPTTPLPSRFLDAPPHLRWASASARSTGRSGPAGARVPVQTAARAWVESALGRIASGAVVAIDYAATTAELAQVPEAGWLRTYRDQHRGGAPLDEPGAQDLTADVCIDQLPAPDARTDQAAFLRRHGIDELVAEGRRIWEERAHLGDLTALRARSRVAEAEALLDPAGLGRFVVMLWNAGGGQGPTIEL